MATSWLGVIPPPPGIEPNFQDPPNQLHANIAVHTVFLTLTTLSVAVRLYTRTVITKAAIGADDCLCFFSYVFVIAFSGLLIKSYVWGVGRHIWDEPSLWLPTALKYFTFSQYIFLILSCAIKLTFFCFYYRIFAAQVKTRFFIIFGFVFVLCSHTALLLVTIFSCKPVAHAWNPLVHGHCNPHPKVLPYTAGVLSLITDLYILILPMPSLWRLHLELSRKVKMIALFGLGVFACITSLIRLIKTPIIARSVDLTWNISDTSVWCVIEVNVGLIVSSSTLLPAFFDRHWPKAINSSITRLSSYLVSHINLAKGSTEKASITRGAGHMGTSNTPQPGFIELNDHDSFPSVLHGTNASTNGGLA